MTDKVHDFLVEPKRILEEIKRAEAARAGLIEAMRPCAIRYDKDRVQGSMDDTMSRYMERMDTLERRLRRLRQDYLKAHENVIEKLSLLPDPSGTILTQRYIGNTPFQDIASGICLSERQMFRYYHEGCARLDEIL